MVIALSNLLGVTAFFLELGVDFTLDDKKFSSGMVWDGIIVLTGKRKKCVGKCLGHQFSVTFTGKIFFGMWICCDTC